MSSHSVAAIDPMYCNPAPITLHLKELSWMPSDDYTIRERYTDELYFRINSEACPSLTRMTLLDPNNVPVAYMRDECSKTIFNISPTRDANQQPLRIEAKGTTFETILEGGFRNVVNGCDVRIGLYGNYRAHDSVIWMDQGNGQKLPVARIHRPSTLRAMRGNRPGFATGPKDNYVDIAPNVDMALIALVCAALDQHTMKYPSWTHRHGFTCPTFNVTHWTNPSTLYLF